MLKRNLMIASVGAGVVFAFATAALYWVAPVKETPPSTPRAASWRLAPLVSLSGATGATLALDF